MVHLLLDDLPKLENALANNQRGLLEYVLSQIAFNVNTKEG